MKGRPPKPRAVKKLAGNPGKRSLDYAEPQPEAAIIRAPAHLKGEARKEWNRIIKILYPVGLFTLADRAVLSLYCSAWGRAVQAEKRIAALEGNLIRVTDKGYEHISPWVTVLDKAYNQMLKAGTQLGLSPVARARLRAPQDPDSGGTLIDELERVLGKPVKVGNERK